jgi:hypothetical protein
MSRKFQELHMSTTAADSIAGVVIPDTALVREITAFIRDTEDDLLFDHSRRVFLFGVLQGRRRGLQPDLELLYAGAMFHDVGLTEAYRASMLRFEVDGANAARDFLLDHGVGEADARKVWLSIALRPTCWESTVTRFPQRRSRPSPPPTHDQISSTGFCERSTTATNTARTARSETSTLTYSSISTHRSSATISSMPSATTLGPSEMHSDSTH